MSCDKMTSTLIHNYTELTEGKNTHLVVLTLVTGHTGFVITRIQNTEPLCHLGFSCTTLQVCASNIHI